MLNRASGRLRALYYPQAILLFQRVSDLHPCTIWRPCLWLELHLRLGLIALNGKTRDVHVHGAKIDRFQGSEMLIDAGPDGIGIAFLFLASSEERKEADRDEQAD